MVQQLAAGRQGGHPDVAGKLVGRTGQVRREQVTASVGADDGDDREADPDRQLPERVIRGRAQRLVGKVLGEPRVAFRPRDERTDRQRQSRAGPGRVIRGKKLVQYPSCLVGLPGLQVRPAQGRDRHAAQPDRSRVAELGAVSPDRVVPLAPAERGPAASPVDEIQRRSAQLRADRIQLGAGRISPVSITENAEAMHHPDQA